MSYDFNRLLTTLQTTGLSQKDPGLFQVLSTLIKQIAILAGTATGTVVNETINNNNSVNTIFQMLGIMLENNEEDLQIMQLNIPVQGPAGPAGASGTMMMVPINESEYEDPTPFAPGSGSLGSLVNAYIEGVLFTGSNSIYGMNRIVPDTVTFSMSTGMSAIVNDYIEVDGQSGCLEILNDAILEIHNGLFTLNELQGQIGIANLPSSIPASLLLGTFSGTCSGSITGTCSGTLTGTLTGIADQSVMEVMSWNSRSANTVYGPAGSDGFLVGSVNLAQVAGAGTSPTFVINTDSSNPPTTARQSLLVEPGGSGTQSMGFPICCPVRKGDYYEAVSTPNTGTITNIVLYWVPLGTAG